MGPGEIATERADPGVTVITFSGEHDLNTAPDLRERLTIAIGERTPIVRGALPKVFGAAELKAAGFK